jgi:[acyl-carrier-protein] S-malonyltransferase
MPKYGFLFPGQGSQKVGMGEDFYNQYQVVKDNFSRASQLLGYDLAEIVFKGPEEKLQDTSITQPALYTVCCSMFDVLKSEGIEPAAVAGHSLGEYVALYAAGFVDFETGLQLVIKRGKAMSKINMLEGDFAPMAAVIGSSLPQIEEVCREVKDVYPAIVNSPAQIVIAGRPEQVKIATDKLKELGAKKVVPLKVSGPFHTVFMEKAAQEFKEYVDKINFQIAEVPIYTNVGTKASREAGEVKEFIVKQIYNSLRWVNVMYNMLEDGIKEYIELGPGTVLKGLFRSTSREAKVNSCRKVSDLEKLLAENSKAE